MLSDAVRDSTDERAGIALRHCVACRERGHYCRASDGGDLCAFCEDGQPCPEELLRRRKAGLQTAPAAAPPIARRQNKRRDIPEKTIPNPPASAPASGENTMRTISPDLMKPCKAAESRDCERLVLAKNKSGYCAKHFYLSKVSGKKTSRRAAPPPRKLASKKTAARRNGDGIATICITEKNLDAFWIRLTLEEKVAIFTSQLEKEI